MKKALKMVILVLISIIIIYAIYIGVEVYRFNNKLGRKPLITTGTINVKIAAGNNLQIEKINGLGFSIQYEYLVSYKENSDHQVLQVFSGNFKLFDKILLSAWVS